MSYPGVSDNVILGENVELSKYINLYGCNIGNNTKIGAFVEVQKKASIGDNCKISSHSFICEGVKIKDNCFIGHGVMFINDNYPLGLFGKLYDKPGIHRVGHSKLENRKFTK